MKKIFKISALLFLASLISVVSCTKDKTSFDSELFKGATISDDAKSFYTDYLTVLEKHNKNLRDVKTADEYAKAITIFSEDLQALGIKFTALKKSMPDIEQEPKTISEAYDKKMAEVSKELMEYNMKFISYMKEPLVIDAQNKLLDAKNSWDVTE